MHYHVSDVAAFEARERGQLAVRRPVLAWMRCMRKSKVNFVLFLAFIGAVFWNAVSFVPVSSLNESSLGVTQWVQNYVRFPRLNGDDGKFTQVETLDDVVLFTRALVDQLLTNKNYAGTTETNSTYRISGNRLVNSLVFSQRRTKLSCVDSLNDFTGPTEGCDQTLNKMSEETRDTHDPTTDSAMLPYDPTLPGYKIEVPLDRDQALHAVQQMIASRWWDQFTRQTAIGFCFHNSVGGFTGSCEVQFDLNPFGNCNPRIRTAFLRLRVGATLAERFLPFVVASLAMWHFALLVASVIGQPHVRYGLAKILIGWNVLEILSYVCLTITGVLLWGYLCDPRRIEADLHAPKSQQLVALAEMYEHVVGCAGLTLFLLVVRAVDLFKVLSPQLSFFVKVISRAVEQSLWFLVIFVSIFFGFAMSAQVLFGEQVSVFSSLRSTVHVMTMWWMTFESPPRPMFSYWGAELYLYIFLFLMMLILFNMFVTIVISAYESVRNEEDKAICRKPLSLVWADCLCDCGRLPGFPDDPFADDKQIVWEKTRLKP